MRPRHAPLACLLGAVLVAGALTGAPTTSAAAAEPEVVNGCVQSAAEPGTTAKVGICYTLFRPAGASTSHRVPMLLHSHGWGGSRATGADQVREFLDAGYGVLSFDQRGFGESGGRAHVENPDFEGKDVRLLVELISRLTWVQQDRPGDPRLGAVGGSYGGGYQFLGAFESLRVDGRQVFDALAPEITWHDLSESLAPEGVVRTEWALALSAAAVPSDALEPRVYKALVEGAATGEWPDGSIPLGENMAAYFERNGPKWHVRQGRRLDIPVLFGQGTTDSLFPLQQGLANWQRAITDKARKRSIFVAYNGGHVLPAIFPAGIDVTSDPCSRELAGGSFRHLSVRFFDEVLKHRDTGLTGWGRLHFATPASTCTTVGSFTANAEYAVGRVATTTALGPPLTYQVAEGPLRIAGSPYLTGSVTALGLKNRAFYGLAVGTSPSNARLVQNNVLPINEPLPVVGAPRRVTLPSVAVDVPAGQRLYLLASAFSDTFAGMGSRTPGVVLIDDTVVHLPVVGP